MYGTLSFSTSKKRIFYEHDFPLLYFQSHLTTKESNFTNNRRNILCWLCLTSSLILRFFLLKEVISTRENIGGLFLKGNLYSSPFEGGNVSIKLFQDYHSNLLSQKKLAELAVRLCKLDFLWSIRLLKRWNWIMRSLIDYFLGGRVWRTTISYINFQYKSRRHIARG